MELLFVILFFIAYTATGILYLLQWRGNYFRTGKGNTKGAKVCIAKYGSSSDKD